MAGEDTKIRIGADATSAEKEIRDFERKAGKSLKGVESSFDSLKAVAGLSLGVLSAKTVVDFFSGAIDAAKDQERQYALLDEAMKRTGTVTDQTRQQMKDFIDLMESNTLFSDEDINNGLQLALSFGASHEEAKKLVDAASELSTVTGKDLATSVQLLGGTLSGTLGSLGKFVAETKSLSDEQLAAGKAIDIVLEKFGGRAESQMDTFAGKVDTLSDAWGNFAKKVGESITKSDILKTSLDLVAGALKAITDVGSGPTDATKAAIAAREAELKPLLDEIRAEQAKPFGNIPGKARDDKKLFELQDRLKELRSKPLTEYVQATEAANEKVVESETRAAERIAAIRKDTAKKTYAFDPNRLDKDFTGPSLSPDQRDAADAYQAGLSRPEDKYRTDPNFMGPSVTTAQRVGADKYQEDLANRFVPDEKTIYKGIGAAFSSGDGAAGAKAVGQMIGANMADVFIPGLGQAVGPILGVIMDGPDATKAFIKDFIAAVPEIVTAVAESMPVIVEVFVDTMVNRGGAVRIAMAIARAMAGEAILKSIGKQIGVNAGDAFTAPKFRRTIVDSFDIGRKKLDTFPTRLNESATRFQNAGKDMGTSISNALKEAPGLIRSGFVTGSADIKEKVQLGLENAVVSITDKIKDGFKNLALPTIPTPPWLEDLIDAISDLQSATGGGGGSGGYLGQLAEQSGLGLTGGSGDYPSTSGGIPIVLKIDGQVLATSILNLSRRGARLTA